jgi:hypothetical protein
MNPFIATYEELSHDFDARGIPFRSPGFCDHPSFLEAERINPGYLNHYAAFVAKRYYDRDYLSKAKTIIDESTARIHGELVKNGRLGACVDISGILFRILEEERIWSCCVKGSLTIVFPRKTRINTKYFWSVDQGNFFAGHAWLYAPPYTVVDIAVRQQPYRYKEREYIPDRILTTNDEPVDVDVEDIISPTVRADLFVRGIPGHLHLAELAQYIPDIFCAFHPIEVPGLRGAKLKYSPTASYAPDGKLSGITNMTFSGLTPWQFYKSYLAGKHDVEA